MPGSSNKSLAFFISVSGSDNLASFIVCHFRKLPSMMQLKRTEDLASFGAKKASFLKTGRILIRMGDKG